MSSCSPAARRIWYRSMAFSTKLWGLLTTYAQIDNLFDRHYQDPIGFLRPGLGVFAGLRVAFDTAVAMR